MKGGSQNPGNRLLQRFGRTAVERANPLEGVRDMALDEDANPPKLLDRLRDAGRTRHRL